MSDISLREVIIARDKIGKWSRSVVDDCCSLGGLEMCAT